MLTILVIEAYLTSPKKTSSLIMLVAVFALLATGAVTGELLQDRDEPALPPIPNSVNQSLPRDFKFGFASAATQVEGASHEDVKSYSIWDWFALRPGAIVDGSSPSNTIDEYHRMFETVRLLKRTGANTYRFSIAWPRLIPAGVDGSPVNPLAVSHYHQVP